MLRCLRCVLLIALAGAMLPVVQADDKQTGPSQKAMTFEKEIKVKVKLNYLLFLPHGYEKATEPWPLMLFLHGSGESGNDPEKVKKHGPPKIVEKKIDLPFVVVSPQSPGGGWNVPALNALLDEILANYKVDPDRVYLTGLSMGGMGTWALAGAHPERFAAIVPICGRGNLADVPKMKDLPVWIFHGAKDTTVRPDNSEAMAKALEKVGAEVKFTLYPDAAHDSWTVTYNNPELYKWLLAHRRKK